jgi:hypothetical protein
MACADIMYRAHAAPPRKHVIITSMGTAMMKRELPLVPQSPNTRVPMFSKAKSKIIRNRPTISAIFTLLLVLLRCSAKKSSPETKGTIHQLNGITDGTMKIPSPKKKTANSKKK